MKGFIDTLATGIITGGGTIITATNHTLIKSTAPARMESIAIPPIKSMGITRALDTGIMIMFTAGTHTALKAIPTESISN